MRVALSVAAVSVLLSSPCLGEVPEPPGLGDPGAQLSLSLTSMVSPDGVCRLQGRDARAQLCVTASFDSGQQRDITRAVHYQVEPAGIVQVDETGFLVPQAEGKALIRVESDQGLSAELRVEVSHLVVDVPVNFPNQVVPVFTKYGCNGGGCHGKSGGQNGFRLSLLGFVPEHVQDNPITIYALRYSISLMLYAGWAFAARSAQMGACNSGCRS